MDPLGALFQVVGWLCVAICAFGVLLIPFAWLKRKLRHKPEDSESDDHDFWAWTNPPPSLLLIDQPLAEEDEEPEAVQLARQTLLEAGFAGIQVLTDSATTVTWAAGVGSAGEWGIALVAEGATWVPGVQWRLGEELLRGHGGTWYRVSAEFPTGEKFLASTEPQLASEWPPGWIVHHFPGLSPEEFFVRARQELAGQALVDRPMTRFNRVCEEEFNELVAWQVVHGEPSLNEIRRMAKELGTVLTPETEQGRLRSLQGLYADLLEGHLRERYLLESKILASEWVKIQNEVVVATRRSFGSGGLSLLDIARKKLEKGEIELLWEFEEPVAALVIHDPESKLWENS